LNSCVTLKPDYAAAPFRVVKINKQDNLNFGLV